MDDNGQDSRQPRKGPLSHGIDAFRTGRTLGKAVQAAKLARASGTLVSAAPAAGTIAIVAGVLFLVLFLFIFIKSTGFAENAPEAATPTPAPAGGGGSPTAKCSAGANLCSPQNLSAFGNNATTASIVCNGESGGQSSVINDGCLKGTSVDYSVGLFQINMLAHCPRLTEIFSCIDTNADGDKRPNCAGGTYCVIRNKTLLNECVNRYSSTAGNISKALELSQGGTNWSAWGAAYACGIL